MAARIARHRAERPAGWRTIEEPKAVAAVIRGESAGVLVVDCLTIWLANVMGDDPAASVAAALDDLEQALRARRSAVIAVSNEVGLGIVPEHPLAPRFPRRRRAHEPAGRGPSPTRRTSWSPAGR